MNPPNPTKQDEEALALICAIATAIVAVAAGQDGKNAYLQLKKLIRQLVP